MSLVERFRKLDASAIDHLYQPIAHLVQRYRLGWSNFTLTRFCIIAANVLFTYALMKYYPLLFSRYLIIGILGIATIYSLWRTARVERIVMRIIQKGMQSPLRETFILSRAIDWAFVISVLGITLWFKHALPFPFMLAITFHVSEQYFLACSPLPPEDVMVRTKRAEQNC